MKTRHNSDIVGLRVLADLLRSGPELLSNDIRNAGRQENRNRPETKWSGSIHAKIFVNFVCFCSKILSASWPATSLLQMRFEQKETKVTKCVRRD